MRLRWFIPLLLLLCASSAHAQCSNTSLGSGVTCVTSGKAFTGGSDCDITLSISTGQYILFLWGDNTLSGTLTISDTIGNTFSNPQGPFTDSGNNIRTNVWVVASSGTNASDVIDAHTTNNAQFAACTAVVLTGLTASPLDQTPAGTSIVSTTNASVGPTGTTTQATELIIGLFGEITSGSFEDFNAGTGYTLLDTSAGQGASTGPFKPVTGIVANVVTSTGSYTPQAVFAHANSGGGFALSLKTPASASQVKPPVMI